VYTHARVRAHTHTHAPHTYTHTVTTDKRRATAPQPQSFLSVSCSSSLLPSNHNMLQCIATQCHTLQHTATSLFHFPAHAACCGVAAIPCNTLHNTLQHTVAHHTSSLSVSCSSRGWPRTATHCNTLQHTATHCSSFLLQQLAAKWSQRSLMGSFNYYTICSQHSFA